MRSCRAISLLLLCPLVFGCATETVRSSLPDVTPVTYAPVIHKLDRSVGKLRRLLVLPIQLEVSPKNPKGCLDECAWVGLTNNLASQVVSYLKDERGYDVLSWDDLIKGDTFQAVLPDGLEDIARKLLEYARNVSSDGPPGEAGSLVKDLAGCAGLDGLVLVHGNATSFSLWDWALGYASFTLSFPLSMLRVGVSLRADIFEAATGRIVWGSAMHAKVVEDPARHLFEPIEPALPRVLTKPISAAVKP
jgi:hypothetical protein